MAKGPAGYTRFLERLLRELPELSQRDPQLADRLQGAQMPSDDWMIKIPHPLMSDLRWAFRQNRITKNKESKTLNVECTPKRTYAVSQSGVAKAWRASGLDGDVGFNDREFFFQIVWGYGRETDNLVYDQHLIDNLRIWALDAMCLAIQLVEGLLPDAHPGDENVDESVEPVAKTSLLSRHKRRIELSNEGLLEDMIIDQWDELDWGADLEYTDRQVRCANIGIIDILARNRTNGNYVVIELKKQKADDEVFGQLSRYVGEIMRTKAEAKGVEVEGIIVASEITPKLRSAIASNPATRAVEYSVQISLKPAGD